MAEMLSEVHTCTVEMCDFLEPTVHSQIIHLQIGDACVSSCNPGVWAHLRDVVHGISPCNYSKVK